MTKWFVAGLGAVLGIGHVAMIGLLVNKSNFPAVNLPVGDYTSYHVEADKDGYSIQYNANDPKVMSQTRSIDKPAGFLGLRRATIDTHEEYTMDGAKHLGGQESGKLSARQVECIKAEGGGQSTGAMVGSSIGASFAPVLSGIPFVGWLATGWATMMGQNIGGDIGGQMATEFADCDEELSPPDISDK
tara:strand:+ start:9551 stop:10114 length:564 start_codon:yes stop_codon:yes gene_type:complete